MATTLENRRVHGRVILRCIVEVALRGSPSFKAQASDISGGGISIFLDSAIRVATPCEVRAMLPLAQGLSDFAASGKVVHCLITRSGYRIGIEFQEIDEVNAKLLAACIEYRQSISAPIGSR